MAAGPTRRALLAASAAREAVLAGGPTRRAVLAGSVAAVPVLISGCRGVEVLGTPPPPAPRCPAAAGDHRGRAAHGRPLPRAPGRARAGPSRRGSRPLLTEHEQHLAQLRTRLVVPGGSAQSLAVRRPRRARARHPTRPVPWQRCARPSRPPRSRSAPACCTVPPSLAQLLASISASEATHVPVLDAAAEDGVSRAAAGRKARAARREARAALSPQAVTALQAALAAEQAASYGYGVVGAHLNGTPRSRSARRADWVAHQAPGTRSTAMIRPRRRPAGPGRRRLSAAGACADTG